MAEETPEKPAPRSNLKRYLYIGIPIVVVVAVLLIVFWPRIRLTFNINGLNSDNPETRRVIRDDLIHEPREVWIDDMYADAVADSSRSFNVRHMLVDILLERDRLASHVEPTYLKGDLDTRSVILAALQGRPYFMDTHVADPRFQVRETVRRWLERDGDFTRSHAIQIAMQIELEGAMDLIRPLLDLPRPDDVHESDWRTLLIAAIGAVRQFEDCQSLPALMRIARSDAKGELRWRAAQALDRLVSGDEPPCADGAVTDADVTQLMIDFLDESDSTLRIGALQNLEVRPERGAQAAARVLEIFQSDAAGGNESPERRHALHVLMAIGAPAFLDTLPICFFDENRNVRSSLAQKAGSVETPRLDSCLIGLVQREVQDSLIFRAACDALRLKSRSYAGLPASLQKLAINDRNAFWADLEILFAGDPVEGATREDMVKGWFEWLAGDLHLDKDETAKAWEAKQAFWDAADRGDVDAARSALDAISPRVPGLFTYEEAWLELNGG